MAGKRKISAFAMCCVAGGIVVTFAAALGLARHGYMPSPVLSRMMQAHRALDGQLASRSSFSCQIDLLDNGVSILPARAHGKNSSCYLKEGVRLLPDAVEYRYAPTGDTAPPRLSCEMARKLREFETRVLRPAALAYMGSELVEILHQGSYECREQRSAEKVLSEHSFGEAFDFSGFVFKDGQVLKVTEYNTAPGNKRDFLKQVAKKACEHFGTSLTPAFNQAHADHIHVSMGFFGKCVL